MIRILVPATLALATLAGRRDAQEPAPLYPDLPAGFPPAVSVENSDAASAAEMKPYTERIPGSSVGFDMLAIPGGRFTMGSPESEAERRQDEGPQHEVEIAPIWIGRCEVTWDEYRIFQFKIDLEARKGGQVEAAPQDAWADAVSRPTPPYVPMDFGMGVSGFPAVCMTQFAARQYTKWLSFKTGRFYRLPTEAEWEYACRAGTTGAYSFGDDLAALDEHAWSFDNANDKYQKVGAKKPNPWGLFDMHGNVAEWTLDRYDEGTYAARAAAALAGPLSDPVLWPEEDYPRVVRGGSWNDDPELLRSAARTFSRKGWKVQDPQLPKSIWYFTDAAFVGFRVVRSLAPPSDDEMRRWWDADVEDIAKIQDRQRNGGR